MIYRIVGSLMFAFLVIALVLSFAGVSEVHLGNGFTNWLRYVNGKFEGWSFQIPKIPEIPLIEQSGGFIIKSHYRPVTTPVVIPGSGEGTTVGSFFNFLNIFITFFNFIIKFLNFVITIVNILIQVIQFILTMVYAIKELPTYLKNDEWALYGGATSIWWWPSVGA